MTSTSASDKAADSNLATVIDSLEGHSEEQCSVIDCMKHLLTITADSITASITTTIELLPPEILLSLSVMKRTILFRHLRDVLRTVGITVEAKQGLQIPMAIATALYTDDAAMMKAAKEHLANWRMSSGTSVTNSGSDQSGTKTSSKASGLPQDGNSSRNIDAASKHFVEKRRFSGILGESPSLPEVRDAYLTYCNQKNFSRQERVKLMSCILKGPALAFWNDHIQSDTTVTQVADVLSKLEKQFDSPAHQRQIESMALSLTVENIRKKNSCGRIAALGTLYHEVSRLNAQFPKLKRGEAFKVNTLMKIVERYIWSRTAEEDVMRDDISYQDLYSKLSASLVIWENEVKRSGRDPDDVDDRRASNAASHFIGYGSQYALPPSSNKHPNGSTKITGVPYGSYAALRNRFNPSTTSRLKRDKSTVQCFKCRRFGHYRNECKEDSARNMIEATRNRMK